MGSQPDPTELLEPLVGFAPGTNYPCIGEQHQ